jgi:hypothetical protein
MLQFTRRRLSRINARRLLDDMASMYSHPIEDTVLIEAIANSLDAGCSRISLEADQARRTLTVRDDGRGMTESEFELYHDLAESTKVRGHGIGFAGLGAKLAHQLATRVRTDTRSDSYSGGTDWYWSGDDLEFATRRCRMSGSASGTQVQIELGSGDSPLLDPAWLEQTVRMQYAPLFDPVLAPFFVFAGIYPTGVRIEIDGRALQTSGFVAAVDVATSAYRGIVRPKGRKPIGQAFFAVMKAKQPERNQGVYIATRGKVIRKESLGMFPRSADRIVGLVEVPALVECLTTTKQDFFDSGKLGAKYRLLRTQIQRAYSDWLVEVGQNVGATERKRAPRLLERELSDLARFVPELDYLFGRRVKIAGPVKSADGDSTASLVQGALPPPGGTVATGDTFGYNGTSESTGTGVPGETGDNPVPVLQGTPIGDVPTRIRNRKPRRGPRVRLVHDPARPEMSWLEPDSVVVNTAHPAYVKAQREGQVKYHRRLVALVAMCTGAAEEDRLELLRRAIAVWGSH